MNERQFRLAWFAVFISSMVAAVARGGEPLPFYDLTHFAEKPDSLREWMVPVTLINTSVAIFDDAKIKERAIAREKAGGAILIDIEHIGGDDPKKNPILRRYGREITDREILSVACRKADLVRSVSPRLQVGVWVMNKIDAAPYQDNLSGDLDPEGNRARRSLTLAADWVGIGAYHWNEDIRHWKKWYPMLIHQRRLAWRTRLVVFLNVQYRDGSLVPLKNLEEIYSLIKDDCDGVGFFSFWRYREQEYDDRMPWVQFAKKLRAE